MQIVSLVCITLVAVGLLAALMVATAGVTYASWRDSVKWLCILAMFFVAYTIFTFLIGMYREAYGIPFFFWEWESIPLPLNSN